MEILQEEIAWPDMSLNQESSTWPTRARQIALIHRHEHMAWPRRTTDYFGNPIRTHLLIWREAVQLVRLKAMKRSGQAVVFVAQL
jgi:hypothetical protein